MFLFFLAWIRKKDKELQGQEQVHEQPLSENRVCEILSASQLFFFLLQ